MVSAEEIERRLGITLRPWQRKVLNQIPDSVSGDSVVAIRAPTGSGKTLISLLLSLYKFDAKTIIAGVRTRMQAGGRSIRSNEDRAVWVLADYRFSYLPKEWGLVSY